MDWRTMVSMYPESDTLGRIVRSGLKEYIALSGLSEAEVLSRTKNDIGSDIQSDDAAGAYILFELVALAQMFPRKSRWF